MANEQKPVVNTTFMYPGWGAGSRLCGQKFGSGKKKTCTLPKNHKTGWFGGGHKQQ